MNDVLGLSCCCQAMLDFGANVYEINCAQTKYKYDTFQQPQMDENITQLKAELFL